MAAGHIVVFVACTQFLRARFFLQKKKIFFLMKKVEM